MPQKPKSRRQVLTELRRTEILEAALKLFGKKGFIPTRMDDIADRAHLAKGTLYLYFKSKDAIYEAAIERAAVAQTEQSTAAIASVTGVAASLEAFLHTRMSFWTSHPDLYRLLVTLGRERQFRKQTQTLIRESVDELLTIFAAGIRSGEIAERDYESASWAIMDRMRGMNERRMYNESTSTIEQDTADILAMVLPHIGLESRA